MSAPNRIITLYRPGICLAVGAAAAAGALLAVRQNAGLLENGSRSLRTVLSHSGPAALSAEADFWLSYVGTALAAALLAAACSAWNQMQEAAADARMSRTAGRPVASGRMRPASALLCGLAAALPALFLLSFLGGSAPAALGLGVIFLYNGLYTPLKGRSSLALLPGAAAGALPLPLGWLAAGGSWTAPVPWMLCALAFLWQMPHFWLRAERWRDEWPAAGFPPPGGCLAPEGLRRLAGLWIAALGAAILSLPLFFVWTGVWPRRFCLAAGLWCLGAGALLVLRPGFRDGRSVFFLVDIPFCLVLCAATAGLGKG